MTEMMGTPSGTSVGGSTTPSSDASTRDVAKEEAKGVAQDAVQSGKQTAETAKQQAGEVAAEAKSQAQALVDQTREEVVAQGSAQQQKAAGGLRSLADELTGMVEGQGGSGIASDLARQASDRVRTAADWLESREPSDLLWEVRRFARQRPGTFLLGAAVVGFIGGRLTRGAVDEARDSSDDTDVAYRGYTGGYSATGTGLAGTYTGTAGTGYAETGYAETGYTEGGYTGTGYGETAAVSTAQGVTSPSATMPPASAGGLSTASETIVEPHGDPVADFTPTAPQTGVSEAGAGGALISDPAGEDRIGNPRTGGDPV